MISRRLHPPGCTDSMLAGEVTTVRLDRTFAAVLLAPALLVMSAAPVPASELSATRYGAVDFGDRVPYRVAGPDCESASPQVVVTAGGQEITGAPSQPRVDGIDPSGCTGAATVPSWREVTDTGWQQGDPIDVELREGGQSVPLRYFRIEADRGEVAAGAPTVAPAGDQDTGAGDEALTMSAGDSVSLGRVDLGRVEALSLRLCIVGSEGLTHFAPQASSAGYVGGNERIEPPVIVSIRQNSPSGPALIGPVDVSSNPTNLPRLSTEGFHGCYRLVHLPVTGPNVSESPELFVTVEAAAPGVLQLNSVDVVGTGAKIPPSREDDSGAMETIFDGSSWDGWTQTGCRLNEDGSASNLRTGSEADVAACVMTFDEPMQDVVIQLDLRRRHFLDNGGILVGHTFPRQIQLRSVGEYGVGGYNGSYAARASKLNTWPDWSRMRIAQLGARYVVTINGRTVTDFTREDGAPAPYKLSLQTEPEWSFRTGAANGFGNEASPDVVRPTEWGDYWFRDIRVLHCSGPGDPSCTALVQPTDGQASPK